MKNKGGLSVYLDILWLALGEATVTLIVSAVYLLIEKYSYTVLTGALLGSAVTVVNFLILSVAVNRAVNAYIQARGTDEMDDETAEKYAKEHGMAVQNAMTKSYILRTVLMLGALVLAMISGYFDPLATVIPLIMYRPVLYLTELIKKNIAKRRGK